MSPAPRRTQSIRRLLGVVVLGMVVLAVPVAMFQSGPVEPEYQGRRLGEWLKGHPRDYTPAVRAVGTNAMPWLISELTVTDSWLSQRAQAALAKVSIGAGWSTARKRHYRARLAIQILDTNAVPALVDFVLSIPMRDSSLDNKFEVAGALDGSQQVRRRPKFSRGSAGRSKVQPWSSGEVPARRLQWGLIPPHNPWLAWSC